MAVMLLKYECMYPVRLLSLAVFVTDDALGREAELICASTGRVFEGD